MAKSDLLKEAIADARAVKETALANAKIALQEAFAPRIESMLAAKLSEELEDEESFDEPVADDMPVDGMGDEEMNMDDMGDEEMDLDGMGDEMEFDLPAPAGKIEYIPDAETAEAPIESEVAPEEEYNEDLDLESIIRELEVVDEVPMEEPMEEPMGESYEEEGENIDEIIEAILREEEEMEVEPEAAEEELKEVKSELEEAYKTVRQLKSIINEVNLLNAKLLYTNKLFRNFDLNENQKMKVLESFDRAGNTREVKLVFSTMAESFVKPAKKRVVKESYASKPVASTKPESKAILAEGFELANRWKKLAGLK